MERCYYYQRGRDIKYKVVITQAEISASTASKEGLMDGQDKRSKSIKKIDVSRVQ